MKNRVILNGQGVPVVPAQEKIFNQDQANQNEKRLRASILKVAAESYLAGADTALECLRLSFSKAIDAGHQAMSLADGVALLDEVRKLISEKLNEKTMKKEI